MIDPGDNATSILSAAKKEKLDIKYVLLTHAHFDHILAAHEVLAATHRAVCRTRGGSVAAQAGEYGSVPLVGQRLCGG